MDRPLVAIDINRYQQMAAFNIPIQELKDKGVNTDQLVKLLQLIHAPQDCTGIYDAIWLMRESVSSLVGFAPSSSTLNELALLLKSVCKTIGHLPRHKTGADMNAMMGRYEDHPLYSLLTQEGTMNESIAFGCGFKRTIGIILTAIWVSNKSWNPVPSEYAVLVSKLRIIRRENKSNKLFSIVCEAESLQNVIDRLASESSRNDLTTAVGDLAVKIQASIPEFSYQETKAHNRPFSPDPETCNSLPAEHTSIDAAPFHEPGNALPTHTAPPIADSAEIGPDSKFKVIERIILGENPSDADAATAESFREILKVLMFDESIYDQLGSVLQTIEPLLPIAAEFDKRYTDVWIRWASTIPVVLDILRNLPHSSVTSPNNQKGKINLNPWHRKIGKFPFITCLNAEINHKPSTGLLPAKAILLIRFYSRYRNDGIFSPDFYPYEKFLADTIRKFCNSSRSLLGMESIPAWSGSSPAEWRTTFLSLGIRFAPDKRFVSYYPNRSPFDALYALYKTLLFVSNDKPNHSPPTQQESPFPTQPQYSPPHDRRTTVVNQPTEERYSSSGRKLSVGPSFDLFHEQPTRPDINTAALAPDAVRVVPQQATAADQPVNLAAIQSLEVRYTNYRSAMDNQRLPWSWDCLNHFEISALRSALNESADLEHATISEKLGAFFVWLLLATGQTIEQILQLGLVNSTNNRGSILPGPIYRRYIHPPPYAFHPSKEQSSFLLGHAEYIDIALPPPFPALIGELGLTDSSVKLIKQQHNLGEHLKLKEQEADKVVRQFLEAHRTRTMRLLPGRIRNVLGAEIMRISNDPVATHHLTALPSDMPPSGVYYTSFSRDVLKRIYEEALTRIFGESA